MKLICKLFIIIWLVGRCKRARTKLSMIVQFKEKEKLIDFFLFFYAFGQKKKRIKSCAICSTFARKSNVE
jgi:hypothetical protein